MSETFIKPSLTKWVPKKWKPIYTKVVALHITGMSNEQVAAECQLGKQQVCNIINTPQAKLIMAQMHDKILKAAENNIDSNLQRAAIKAAERIRNFIENDELANNSPVSMMTQSLKVLSAVGKTKGEQAPAGNSNTLNVKGNMFVMTQEAAKEMSSALDLARKVDEIHGSPLALMSGGEDVTGTK